MVDVMGNGVRTMALAVLSVLLGAAALHGVLVPGVACLGLGAAGGAVGWRLHHAWLVRHRLG
jgi:hypothetical protein